LDLSTTILVLKKTKLGEADLIITGLTEEGVQIRAVAKSARKPGSKLGVHLELFSLARVLIYQGRGLGIIKEAQTLCHNDTCRSDVMHSAGAAVVVELLDRTTADGAEEARLFPLAREALRCLGEVKQEGIALIAAAAILKVAAQLGFRPSLQSCVVCGRPYRLQALAQGDHRLASFSFDQGGIICDDCRESATNQRFPSVESQIIQWADVLITSRFVDLEGYADDAHEELGYMLLGFAREWIRYHLVRRLKSLDFLLSFR